MLAKTLKPKPQNLAVQESMTMIDAAIDSRVVSSATWRKPTGARVAVALCFFLNGVLFASWVSRIPVIQASLGLSHGVLGLALFGVALGALFAMPVTGWCVSRYGSRRTTQIIAAAYCVIMPFLAVAPNAIWLTLALFWFGAFHGAFDIGMNAQAVAVEKRYGRPIMSSFHALWSVGGLTGAALGALIAASGIPPIIHFTAVSLLIGGASLAFANARLFDANDANPRVSLREKGKAKFTWPPRTLVALGAVAFCIMMGEGAMADWGAVFLRNSAGASEAIAASGYAVFSIAMAATRFSGDWLSARLGPVMVVRLGSGLAATGLATSLLSSEPVAALLGFGAVGAGFATIVPQVFSAAGRTSGMDAGTALATATTIGYSGFLIGPPLIGFAAEAIGLRGALAIIVIMSVVAILLAPSVRRAD